MIQEARPPSRSPDAFQRSQNKMTCWVVTPALPGRGTPYALLRKRPCKEAAQLHLQWISGVRRISPSFDANVQWSLEVAHVLHHRKETTLRMKRHCFGMRADYMSAAWRGRTQVNDATTGRTKHTLGLQAPDTPAKVKESDRLQLHSARV